MTEPEVWDRLMSDVDFVDISLPYFKKKYWSLHEGCCLIAKVNPQTHPGVGAGYEDWSEDDLESEKDYTRRPFQVALRSILARSEADLFEFEKPKLDAHRVDTPLVNGNSVLLDATVFVEWVLKRWPEQTMHFESAWKARQNRKANSISGHLGAIGQTKGSLNDAKRREAFVQLRNDMGSKYDQTSDRELAKLLADRIKTEKYSAKPETLRKSFSKWRAKLFE